MCNGQRGNNESFYLSMTNKCSLLVQQTWFNWNFILEYTNMKIHWPTSVIQPPRDAPSCQSPFHILTCVAAGHLACSQRRWEASGSPPSRTLSLKFWARNNQKACFLRHQVGTLKTAAFCSCAYFLFIDWSNFHIFLLACERMFRHTKKCDILILYTKVMKGLNFFNRCFIIVSSTYIYFENIHKVMMAIFGMVRNFGCIHLSYRSWCFCQLLYFVYDTNSKINIVLHSFL